MSACSLWMILLTVPKRAPKISDIKMQITPVRINLNPLLNFRFILICFASKRLLPRTCKSTIDHLITMSSLRYCFNANVSDNVISNMSSHTPRDFTVSEYV